MLILDDILLFPARGVGWFVEQVRHAAQQEQENESDNLRAELGELYMRLETRQISQEEFDAEEKELLDRLDKSESPNAGADREPEPDR